MFAGSGTATTDKLVTLYNEVAKLEIMLRQYNDGSALNTKPGRFTSASIDTQVTAVSTAITAVNA